MILIVKNRRVIATHDDHQLDEVAGVYPDAEIVEWPVDVAIDQPDPRTEQQRLNWKREQTITRMYDSAGDRWDITIDRQGNLITEKIV